MSFLVKEMSEHVLTVTMSSPDTRNALTSGAASLRSPPTPKPRLSLQFATSRGVLKRAARIEASA